jgi:dTDP-4-amino-4,6-dideoxygalactose transaminase
VTTNDPELARRVEQLRDHGQVERHDHAVIGYNARLDALQCACLSISLRSLAERNEARRALARRYREQLCCVPGVRLIAEAPGSQPVYHLFVGRVAAELRDGVRGKLADAGIATAIHYPRPIHRQEAYAGSSSDSHSRPIAERAAAEMISLPMFPTMTEAQVDQVTIQLAHALRAR